MKIRQRTILAMAITVIAIITGVYLLSTNLILDSYRHLEEREMNRNISRVVDAYQQKITALREKCLDWAHWDDAYEFIKDEDSAFIKSNLSTITLKVDSITFLDRDGRVVYSRPVPSAELPNGLSSEALRKAIAYDDNGNYRLTGDQAYSGTVKVGSRLAIVTAEPLVKTDGRGPSRGWIVFAQLLRPADVRSLSSETHLSVELQTFDRFQSEHKIGATALRELRVKHWISIPVSTDAIAGYGLIKDISGNPVVAATVLEPRSVYSRGITSSRYVISIVLVSALVLCIVVLCIWEYFALSRVANLTSQVDHLGSMSGGQIELDGNDELSSLAKKISGALSGLETSKEKLRQNNVQLSNSVEKLQITNSLLENALEGIAEVSESGIVNYANRSFAATLGYLEEEIVGTQLTELIFPDDLERFETFLGILQNLGKAEMDLRFQGKGGGVLYLEAVLVGSFNSSGVLDSIHFFTKDVTERKRLETQIEHQAFHDPLTGIANRAMFMKRLAIAHASSQRHRDSLGVIFIDLDNFKTINDTLGHETGDRFLISMADRLSTCVRPGDMLARLAGDEFVVLLERTREVSDVIQVAERIQESLSRPILMQEGETFGSASMGIAYSEGGLVPPDRLVRNADTAMYQAKSRGKNKFVLFEDSMDIISNDQIELERALQTALQQHEFFLEYQPIYDLKHNRVVGVEALLRWAHPTRGLLAPNLFLPAAEEAGLMGQIGAWTLREACRQVKLWENRRRDLFVSVNLSAQQIQAFEIVGEAVSAFEEHHIGPERLQIEVTEKTAQSLVGNASSTLSALRRAGVRVAIDDFGTGFASNASDEVHIADALKIDVSLTQKVDTNDAVRQLVATIISSGHSHGLQVFAEGVQTEEQLKQLKALGCRYAQGYLLGKPLSAKEIEASVLPRQVA